MNTPGNQGNGGEERILPDYWLSVGGGTQGAIAFMQASTTDARLALLWQHPTLILPEFAMALHAAARKQADSPLAGAFGAAALELHVLQDALAQHAASDYATLTLGSGLMLLEEGRGDRAVNLHMACKCFQRAASLLAPGSKRAECRLSEAIAIASLAEVESAGGIDPERALDLIRDARSMFTEPRDIARCLLNEGNALRLLSKSVGRDAVFDLRRAIQLYREAHDLLGLDPLAAGCRINEGNALLDLAMHGIEPRANLEAAIALYRQAADGKGSTEDRAWCLVNEGQALSVMALLGIDTRARLSEAIARFASARALFGESYGAGVSRTYEATARGRMADLGIESEANAREGVRLFEEARVHFAAGQMHARCLEGEAMLRETLASQGIDAQANLLAGIRLLRAAAVIRHSGPALANCLDAEALVHGKLADLNVEPQHHREEAVRLYGEVRAIEGSAASVGTLINEGNALRDLAGFSRGVHARVKAMLLRQAIRHYTDARGRAGNPDLLASALLNEANARQRMASLEIDADGNLAEAARLADEVRRAQPDGLRAVRSLALEGVVREALAKRGVETERNREMALGLMREAAQRFRELGFADSAMLAYWSRGRVLREQGRCEEARQSFAESIGMLERVRKTASTPLNRQAFMERTSQIFRDIVETCLELERPDDAMAYAERGRSRALVDLLSLHEMTPRNVPSDLADAYRRLRRRLEEIEGLLQEEERPSSQRGRWQDDGPASQLAKGPGRPLRAFIEERALIASDLDRVETKLRQLDPDFLAGTGPVQAHDLQAIAQSLGRPLLLPWIGEQRSLVFVVRPSGESEQILLPEVTSQTIRDWLLGPAGAVKAGGWIGLYRHDPERWREEMQRILCALYDCAMQPIHRWCVVNEVTRIAMIVSGPLGLLPLHAATWHDHTGRPHHLLEEVEILCAPSAAVLRSCLGRRRASALPILVVGDPETTLRDRLPAAEWEITQIARTVLCRGDKDSVRLLSGADATAARIEELLPGCAIAHFACHGEWDMTNPLASSLLVAGDDRLTLGHLIGHVDLGKARLAVLSACDSATGISPESNAEEYLGLPAGFIVAGAQSVVGSLWEVEDEATGLLMTRFYELLLEGSDAPNALRRAQLWLRDLAVDEAERILGSRGVGAFTDNGERPFAHPASWAAFAAFGAPVRMN